MRTINFRDGVLWAIAYKLGLDPATPDQQNFQSDQAAALVSYINAWVRRLWDATDWPEWADTEPFDVEENHVVLYDQGSPPLLARVFKVYLVDPDTTDVPVDVEFRLQPTGVYVGLEHGTQVWIKWLDEAPRFSSDEWDNTKTYNAGDVVYLADTGECYRSMGNNNLNHYPGPVGRRTGIPIETLQQVTAPDPGLVEQDQILVVHFLTAGPPPPPSDPPPASTTFYVSMYDTNGNLLGDASHTSDGSESLATIITALATALGTALGGGFSVNTDLTAKTLTVKGGQAFVGTISFYQMLDGIVHLFKVVITQPFIPGLSGTPGQSQISKVTFSTGQAIFSGSIYKLTFTDLTAAVHTVSYTAQATDGPLQVLAGWMNAIAAAAAGGDAFFATVSTDLDTTGLSLSFTITQGAAVDATLEQAAPDLPTPVPPVPQPPSFWTYVPFPFALADQVVRGAYADALKEAGQSDKAGSEEQAVPAETQTRTAATLAPPYDPLTDQQQAKARYAIK